MYCAPPWGEVTVRHAAVIGNDAEYEPFTLMNGSGFGRANTMSRAVNPSAMRIRAGPATERIRAKIAHDDAVPERIARDLFSLTWLIATVAGLRIRGRRVAYRMTDGGSRGAG